MSWSADVGEPTGIAFVSARILNFNARYQQIDSPKNIDAMELDCFQNGSFRRRRGLTWTTSMLLITLTCNQG